MKINNLDQISFSLVLGLALIVETFLMVFNFKLLIAENIFIISLVAFIFINLFI